MLFGRDIFAAARQAALDVEALVLPVACLGCGRALPGKTGLCDPCRLSLRPIAPPMCGRCGQTLDKWESVNRTRCTVDGKDASGLARAPSTVHRPPVSCGFCRRWPDELAWARSATWFDDGAGRELVHSLKYGGWRVAAGPMARVMARTLAARLREVDLLVPVPLGRLRQRERGYNQAQALAESLAALTKLPCEVQLLARVRETKTQTALDPRARQANVANAFSVHRTPCTVHGKNVALVDDVLTTGATLGAAAQALAEAGAAVVGALTFARAGKPE